MTLQRRNESICTLYRSGNTLQEIGDRHGLTRERIRQILFKMGVSAQEGGCSLKAREKKMQRDAVRDLRYLERYGCTYGEYLKIKKLGSSLVIGSPLNRFIVQKQNAYKRGVRWELSLTEWWATWRASGKWNERGRGDAYVMSRVGDNGPYAIGNVRIAHNMQNVIEHYERTNGKTYGKTRERWEHKFLDDAAA